MIFPAIDKDAGSPAATALTSALASESATNEWVSVNTRMVARSFQSVASEFEAAANGVGAADMGALIRYTLRGPDAATAISKISTAPAEQLGIGESARGLVLSDAGGVVDLADVTRLADELFLMVMSRPQARRLQLAVRGLDANVLNIDRDIAAIGLFGPGAYEAAHRAGFKMSPDEGLSQGVVRGVETAARPISYGAASGYEMIFPRDEALVIWERLKRVTGCIPIGLDALEILRIEGGSPRPGIDFDSADSGFDPSPTPLEIGLPHLAPLDGGWFNGRRALRRVAQANGAAKTLVVMTIDAEVIDPAAMIYVGPKEVGKITSSAFSPRLKSVIAFGEMAVNALSKPLLIMVPSDPAITTTAQLYDTNQSRLAADYRKIAQ